ncbi:MAG: hypothetical protein BWY51_00807 [Parcubacteria group bacterium ADurb.Bin316]|nr:MAG: hypothetical protein BWY51_00807 [Parcubacteria group bacterium ADurb.Bin316]
MKITICGGVKFAQQLVEIYRELEKMGHEPKMHKDMFGIADGTAAELIEEVKKDHAEAKRKYNFIKLWYQLILDSDAILVCNFDKNGKKNYIGGNTLMEIGFAYVNNKRIYLLNPIPTEVTYYDEILAMDPLVINNDLTKIV